MSNLDLIFLRQSAEVMLSTGFASMPVEARSLKELVDRLMDAEEKLESLERFVKNATVLR